MMHPKLPSTWLFHSLALLLISEAGYGEESIPARAQVRFEEIVDEGLKAIDHGNPARRMLVPEVKLEAVTISEDESLEGILKAKKLRYTEENVALVRELNPGSDWPDLRAGKKMVLPDIVGPRELIEGTGDGGVELVLSVKSKRQFLNAYEELEEQIDLSDSVVENLDSVVLAIEAGSFHLSEPFLGEMISDLQIIKMLEDRHGEFDEVNLQKARDGVERSIELRAKYLDEVKNVAAPKRGDGTIPVKVDVLNNAGEHVNLLRVRYVPAGLYWLGPAMYSPWLKEYSELSSGKIKKLPVGAFRMWAIDPSSEKKVTDHPTVDVIAPGPGGETLVQLRHL